MIVPIIIMSVGALFLSWFLYEKIKAYSIKETIIKGCTSLLFISLAIYGLIKTGLKIFPIFALIGLCLGLIGDVALDLKYVYKEKDYEFTITGFVAFALGHVFYITGMFLEFYKNQGILFIIIPFVFGILGSVLNLFMAKPLKLDLGKYKLVVFIYAALLFSFAGSSFSVWMMMGFANTGLLLLFIASLLFAISDLILSNTYFGVDHEKPFDIISNSVTYYAAQFIIALAILFI